MTVASNDRRKIYVGNGVATVFNGPRAFVASHIQAYLGGVLLTSGYSVANLGFGSTTVTFTAPPANGTSIVLLRTMPLTQDTDITNQGKFLPEIHEDAFDARVMQIQQVADDAGRGIKLPLTSSSNGEVTGWAPLGPLVISADGQSVEAGSTQLTGDMLLRPNLAQPSGGSLVGFQQAGTGAVARTTRDKLRDIVTPQDFGATGSAGDVDGGYKIGLAISAYPGAVVPPGEYVNQVPNLTLPLNKSLRFLPGAKMTNAGSGTLNLQGPVIRECNNPGGLSSWTANSPKNFEGFAVELGQPPDRSFGSAGLPIAITGHINIPASASLTNHGAGVAGYADTASPTTAGVGLYGEGNSRANNALAWGINTRTQDNGFFVPVLWGAEIDLNVDNPGTTPIGVEVVGGSTVEPGNSIGFKVSPLNPFNTLKIRWQRAFMSDDGAAIVGLELGSQQNQANSPSQDIRLYYRRNGNVRAQCFSLTTDGSGNTILGGGLTGASGSGPALFDITGNPSGPSPIRINGNNLGFFGTFPVSKGTVTGSKSGNVALDSLLTELARIGLITNSST